MHGQGVTRKLYAIALCAAAVLTAHPALKLEQVMTGLNRPVFVCSPPGDSNRLFVIEQQVSRIRIYDRQTSVLLPTAFLTITGVRRGGEQGLLGLAFHPGYETNGYFFINITPSGGANRTEIQRYRVQGDPKTSNVADPSSREIILSYNQPYDNHNGGWLGFGPDGYLYISSGDGGSGDDPQNNGQRRNTLLGKILRIDQSIQEEATSPYTVPDGNPYKGHQTFRGEIWAFGLRNPWRCSFDRETGNLWIADVGQSAREEIDVNPAGVGGLNFGWRPREGFIQNDNFPNETPVTERTDPIFDYNRNLGVSVTGGYVYRGNSIPELQGKYIFADFGRARFWTTDLDQLDELGTDATVQITNDINPNGAMINNVSSFGEGADGELYVCDLDGQVFKIASEGPQPARVTQVQLAGDDLVIGFDAVASQSYVVQATSLLGQSSNWNDVTTVNSAATNRTVNLTNSVTGTAQFFRIRSEQ